MAVGFNDNPEIRENLTQIISNLLAPGYELKEDGLMSDERNIMKMILTYLACEM
jgi:hypothetical protein